MEAKTYTIKPHVKAKFSGVSSLPKTRTVYTGAQLDHDGLYKTGLTSEQEKEYESGIIKAETVMHTEELLSTVFFVVKMGPDCYKDSTRFPTGPWCKVGDFILARPNSGTRLKIHGREFRIINDDSVEGIVQDPRGITRA
jgi:co-chaperonin GroES (HSP10)